MKLKEIGISLPFFAPFLPVNSGKVLKRLLLGGCWAICQNSLATSFRACLASPWIRQDRLVDTGGLPLSHLAPPGILSHESCIEKTTVPPAISTDMNQRMWRYVKCISLVSISLLWPSTLQDGSQLLLWSPGFALSVLPVTEDFATVAAGQSLLGLSWKPKKEPRKVASGMETRNK